MAVILGDEHFKHGAPAAGKQWAEQFNTGIGSLLNHKMTQVHAQKQANVFKELGLNPAIAHLPPSVQEGLLKEHFVESPKRQREQQIQQQQIADKETLPFFTEIYKENQAAENNSKRLGKMEELLHKGQLSNPKLAALVKTISHGAFGFGLDLTSVLNADSQQFDKLSTDFVRDAKEIFGGRLTDADLSAFFKTVPTLTQSNEGKARLIESMKLASEASKVRYQVTKDLIAANGGRRPANLSILVEQASRPQIDQISQQFKQSFQNVPQDKSFLGSLLGDSL